MAFRDDDEDDKKGVEIPEDALPEGLPDEDVDEDEAEPDVGVLDDEKAWE